VTALCAVSTAPVAYAELPLAQHAFDILASLRCQATTGGVAAFLDAARARTRLRAGRPPWPASLETGPDLQRGPDTQR